MLKYGKRGDPDLLQRNTLVPGGGADSPSAIIKGTRVHFPPINGLGVKPERLMAISDVQAPLHYHEQLTL